jgi:DNA-binding NtrC family response regulator
MTERVLVVDDEQSIRRSLDISLKGEGFPVESVGTGEEALAILERNMDALRARLREIPAEIERETAAAAAGFSNLQSRMYPVAVTFLVPRRVAKA